MVKVWDIVVRVFHWSVVVLFVTAFLTGDEIEWIHTSAGYEIAALIALRLAWGFVGPRHARFSDFVKGPAQIASYLKQAVRLEAPRTLGHNPAGGAMIIALLTMLSALSVTGYLMTTDAYWGSETLEDVHEAFAYVTLALVGLHVVGVILASFEHGENLVRAMITGRKRPIEQLE